MSLSLMCIVLHTISHPSLSPTLARVHLVCSPHCGSAAVYGMAQREGFEPSSLNDRENGIIVLCIRNQES